MSPSLCPSAANAGPPRRLRRIGSGQLPAIAGAFLASIPAAVLAYLFVEDARIAAVFALLIAITLLSLFSEPAGRRGH